MSAIFKTPRLQQTKIGVQMSSTAPSPDGHYILPKWWDSPRFCLTEIAQITGVPIATISLWLTLARATGLEVGDTDLSRPLYSARQLFALALLSRLHGRRVRVNAKIVAAAFEYVARHEKSIPTNAVWAVYDEDGVALNVQAWLTFSGVQHFGYKPQAI
jgi:hypothetical protein